MTKRAYEKAVADLGLGFFSWLKVLPCYYDNGDPITLKDAVPLVYYPTVDRADITAKIKAAGFHFAPSTLHYVPGYDVPIGHEMQALVANS